MLQIIIPAEERWDEEHEEFIVSKKEQKLMLEHSLVSLSKWESKWQVPFLSKKEKTYEETLDYIKCMTITQNVSDDVYNRLDKIRKEKAFPVSFQQLLIPGQTSGALTMDDRVTRKE